MRRLRIWGAAVLWSLMAWVSLPTAFGQQSTVVLSIKSLDELLDDADVIAEVVGQPGIKDQVEMFINAFTSGNGLQGIDRTSGFGVYWNTSEENPLQMPVVFLPVSDSNALQELLKPLVEDFEDTDGSWSMSFNGTKLFAQIKGGYAFVSITPDVLEDLPNAKRLVNAKQDISLAVSIAGIPQPFKDTFLNQTEEQGRAQLENGPPPEGELEKKARDLGFDWTLAVFKSLVNEGDRFTLGWNLDSESRKVTLESSLTGKSNTDLAKAMTAYGKSSPVFAAAAAEDAPFRIVASLPITGSMQQLEDVIDAMREYVNGEIDHDEKLKDDADREAAKDIAKRLFDIGQATVKSGSSHSMLVLEEGDEETVRIIGGTKIAKGDDAGKLFDDIMKLSEKNPEVASVKKDVAKHAGARIHAITPTLNEESTNLFGDSDGHMAVRADSLWFSLGGGNLDALKNALELSGKAPAKSGSKPIAPISVKVKPATLVTLMEEDDEQLIERANSLAGEDGDYLNAEIAPIASGAKLAIEFGLDLFKLGTAE